MIGSVIRPKRPHGTGWLREQNPNELVSMGFPAEAWQHLNSGIFVISAVEVASDDDIDKGPEYHISISKPGRRRCTSQEAKWVLRQFGLEEAEEDNHVPNGFVRNFWRPVADRLVGLECKCKADEPAIREDKGDFVWRGVTK